MPVKRRVGCHTQDSALAFFHVLVTHGKFLSGLETSMARPHAISGSERQGCCQWTCLYSKIVTSQHPALLTGRPACHTKHDFVMTPSLAFRQSSINHVVIFRLNVAICDK